MYNDILVLMNGMKCFIVSMSHPAKLGRFTDMGVLFELEDLKEVSKQMANQIKYLSNHQVTGQDKIHCILNPDVWMSRETYLKVEGLVTNDTRKAPEAIKKDIYTAVVAASKAAPGEENALCNSFTNLVKLQHELQDDIQFT